jgi:hypothetical protein
MSDQVDKLKDFIAARLLAMLQSPHTTIPGLLIGLVGIIEIWLPQYEPQFHKTREFLMCYIGLAAGQIKTVSNPNTTETDPKSP